MRISKPIQNKTPDRTAKTAKHAQTCQQVDTNHMTRHNSAHDKNNQRSEFARHSKRTYDKVKTSSSILN